MKNLLLTNKTAKQLYRSYIEKLPIVDYHNHLSIKDIKNNRRFRDIYELWIEPDPYKHRAMRMCGIPEEKIIGSAAPFEKFIAWCETFPRLLGNPLYDWSRMELSSVFGIT